MSNHDWDATEELERPPLPEIYDVRESPLVGIFVETRTARVKDNFNPGPDGKRDVSVHTFLYENETGKPVAVFGKPDLDGKLSQVMPGDLVRIEVTGEQLLPNSRRMTVFSVKRKAGDEVTKRAARAAANGSSHPVTAGGDGMQFVGDDDIPF